MRVGLLAPEALAMSDGPLLRPEEVAGVLSGPAGTGGVSIADAPPGPLPYSLREPVAVPPAAEAEARRRIEALATAAERGLRAELGPSVALTVDGFQQQRARGALGAVPAPAWLLCFAGSGGGMAIAVGPETGLALVERALGGLGAQAAGARPPTTLEARILSRLVDKITPALSGMLGTGDVVGTQSVGEVPPQVAAPGETVGVGLLRVRVAESERNALMLVSGALLVPKQGEAAPHRALAVGPLAPLLERARVRVRPVLRAGRLSVGEMAQLTVGSIVRLDAPEKELFDLRVVGQHVFSGTIARRDGQIAFSATLRRGGAAPDRSQEGQR
jgi:hypothetical protein